MLKVINVRGEIRRHQTDRKENDRDLSEEFGAFRQPLDCAGITESDKIEVLDWTSAFA